MIFETVFIDLQTIIDVFNKKKNYEELFQPPKVFLKNTKRHKQF